MVIAIRLESLETIVAIPTLHHKNVFTAILNTYASHYFLIKKWLTILKTLSYKLFLDITNSIPIVEIKIVSRLQQRLKPARVQRTGGFSTAKRMLSTELGWTIRNLTETCQHVV